MTSLMSGRDEPFFTRARSPVASAPVTASPEAVSTKMCRSGSQPAAMVPTFTETDSPSKRAATPPAWRLDLTGTGSQSFGYLSL